MVWQHQWDIVARILVPPERGYGQLSCGEPCCSCIGHKGGSHPMSMGASN